MSGAEAGVRIWMQDSGYGYPPIENRSQGFPPHLGALAATNENIPPEPIDALSEGAKLIDIPGNSMVLVVASDHLPKPCTNLTDTIMLPAEKLNLDSCFLSLAAFRTPSSPWDMRFPLCVGSMRG
jgi:hypothetical protein